MEAVIPSSRQKLTVGLLQIVLTGCFFYSLTGGAFLIDWSGISHWKKVLKISTFLAMLLVACTGLLMYRKNKKNLLGLQPFRLIDGFFNLPPVFSLGFLYISFLVTQTCQQLAMHYGLETHLWDLGFYDQVLWNTAHGDFLTTSVRGGLHVFAEHFKPILVLISQLYHFTNEVWALLVVTNFLTASSLIAVYLIAKRLALSHADALAVTLCVFFFSPLVSGINFLYHTQMLIDPFLLWGFYFVLRKRLLLATLLFVFALACKESAVLDLLGLSLFLFTRKEKIPAAFAAFLSIAWLIFFIFWIKPHYIFAGHFKNIWGYYSGWLHPSMPMLLAFFKQPNPFFYCLKIFAPFLFLSFACPGWWLLLGPSLLLRMFSIDTVLRSTTYHYTGGFEALIFISAIYGFASWTQTGPLFKTKGFFERIITALKRPPLLRAAMVIAAIFFAGYSQLVTLDRFLGQASEAANQRVIRVLESIPPGYSVLATQNLAAHVSHRSHMYAFGEMFQNTPYEKLAMSPDLIVYDAHLRDDRAYSKLQDYIGGGYGLIYETDYLLIYSVPDVRRVDPAILRKEWAAIAIRPVISYQFIIRSWYRWLLIAVMVFGMIRAMLKRSHPKNVKEGISILNRESSCR